MTSPFEPCGTTTPRHCLLELGMSGRVASLSSVSTEVAAHWRNVAAQPHRMS